MVEAGPANILCQVLKKKKVICISPYLPHIHNLCLSRPENFWPPSHGLY